MYAMHGNDMYGNDMHGNGMHNQKQPRMWLNYFKPVYSIYILDFIQPRFIPLLFHF
jgi:hypothetical protein